VAAGGAATLTCMYWLGYKAALAATALTVVVIFAWRLPGGTTGYVKDTTAGVFAFAYLPFLASFVAAMLVPADGGRRVLTFVIVTICSDIGGYFAGITGIWMSRLAKAPVSSVSATATAIPMYSRKVALTVNRVRMTRPPSAAPTPIATGRLRPVRTPGCSEDPDSVPGGAISTRPRGARFPCA
jgi:hypothetical protein